MMAVSDLGSGKLAGYYQLLSAVIKVRSSGKDTLS
jgi:hypothetical protein